MNYDRREKIKQLLTRNGAVYIKELEKSFPNVSGMTLRRDLEYFENQGLAIRIRGGARLNQKTGVEALYSLREAENQEAKEKIARIALGFIETGRSVFLDSGTTVMSLARILPDTKLAVITSGPNIGLEVIRRYNSDVHLIGGVLNRHNLSVSGMESLKYVDGLNIDIAFMVASAFSSDAGFSCGNYSECELKRRIIRKARKRILLMDSSKFDKNLPFTFASFSDIDVFITDKKPSDEMMEAAGKANTQVLFK